MYERKQARDWRTDGGFGVGGGHIVRQIRMLLVGVDGDNPLLIPVGEGVFNWLEKSFLQGSFVSRRAVNRAVLVLWSITGVLIMLPFCLSPPPGDIYMS